MDIDEMLRVLGVDAAALEPAPPEGMRHFGDRLTAGRPCVGCGTPARYTTIRLIAGYGDRWLDCCRSHFLAVAKRGKDG